MRRTNADVGTCLAADADAVNIASGAAEGDFLLSTGARRQKHLRRRTRRRRRRRRRCRCKSPPPGHTNDAEPVPAVADAGSSGPDTHSWWDRAMLRALQSPTSR